MYELERKGSHLLVSSLDRNTVFTLHYAGISKYNNGFKKSNNNQYFMMYNISTSLCFLYFTLSNSIKK